MDPVIPFDLQRMLIGDQPALFYAEIVVRTLVIYAWTLGLVRWIGGRGVSQLSLVEIVLVIALGSSVGDAMFYPDVPLLHAMLVILVVVVLNKLLDWAIARWQGAKVVIDGRPAAIVRDGVLVWEGLAARNLGHNEVKAMLRAAGVSNLGQVEHAFLEVSGQASVFRAERPRPGLGIVPPRDVMPADALMRAEDAPRGLACCATCGDVRPAAEALRAGTVCGVCGRAEWTAPVWPADPDTLASA